MAVTAEGCGAINLGPKWIGQPLDQWNEGAGVQNPKGLSLVEKEAGSRTKMRCPTSLDSTLSCEENNNPSLTGGQLECACS